MENIQQRIESVRNDREHGSRWLARETMTILRDMARARDVTEAQVCDAGKELAQARPAMAAIAGAVGRILNAQGGKEGIAHTAEKLLEEYDHAIERIVTFARPNLQGTLMTNSISGTILAALQACKEQIERVIVLEGRPRYEGRDMARELAQQGIPVTLITDAQADIFLPQCSAVVVGADTVLANGDVLNKAGTALLAWAAHGHHVPFYVLCETLKISPRSWSGNLSQLEEKEPEEVLEQPIAGVIVRNFYFDRTSARLITGVITEQGMLSAKTRGRFGKGVQGKPLPEREPSGG